MSSICPIPDCAGASRTWESHLHSQGLALLGRLEFQLWICVCMQRSHSRLSPFPLEYTVMLSLGSGGAQLLPWCHKQPRKGIPVPDAASPEIPSCIFFSPLHRACSSSSVSVLAHKAQPDPLAHLHQGGGGKHPLPAHPELWFGFSAAQPLPVAFPASSLPLPFSSWLPAAPGGN